MKISTQCSKLLKRYSYIDTDSNSPVGVGAQVLASTVFFLLFEKSNNHERFEYVSHELVFQEPIMIHEKEFQMKLQSVLHTPQLVNE